VSKVAEILGDVALHLERGVIGDDGDSLGQGCFFLGDGTLRPLAKPSPSVD
jgi:hypothetical protein